MDSIIGLLRCLQGSIGTKCRCFSGTCTMYFFLVGATEGDNWPVLNQFQVSIGDFHSLHRYTICFFFFYSVSVFLHVFTCFLPCSFLCSVHPLSSILLCFFQQFVQCFLCVFLCFDRMLHVHGFIYFSTA